MDKLASKGAEMSFCPALGGLNVLGTQENEHSAVRVKCGPYLAAWQVLVEREDLKQVK